MIAWIVANWLNLVVGAVVLALVAVCLRNVLPGKGKSSCAGCSGSCGSCGGCAHAGSCPSCKQ